MADYTYNQILESLASYIEARMDSRSIAGSRRFAYTGVVPPVNGKGDFSQFPVSQFPFIGPALMKINYKDENMGSHYPSMDIQIVFADRVTSSQPKGMMSNLLDMVQQIETLLLQAMRETSFEMPEIIRSIELGECDTYPTFYATVDQNKKAFAIGTFGVRLHLNAI